MADLDPELQAMQAILEALEPLDDAGRDRVIDYAFMRLGLTKPGPGKPPPADLEVPKEEPKTHDARDVRTLTEQKQPKSANEMAAIVGYYLAEVAPKGERTAEISTKDIETYFKQANFPLPQVPRKVLPNAAAAGYFESVGSAKYKLNPVGHNLVAHTLPRKGGQSASSGRSTSRRARKTTKATKGKSAKGTRSKPTKKSSAS